MGTFSTSPFQPPSPAHAFGYPGASPSITWDGSTFGNAVVWVLDTTGYGQINFDTNGSPLYVATTKHASIYAYAAQPSGGALSLLWSDTMNGPGSVKFVVPTVAGGMVFVAGGNGLYTPGQNISPANCLSTAPSNCGELVIWH